MIDGPAARSSPWNSSRSPGLEALDGDDGILAVVAGRLDSRGLAIARAAKGGSRRDPVALDDGRLVFGPRVRDGRPDARDGLANAVRPAHWRRQRRVPTPERLGDQGVDRSRTPSGPASAGVLPVCRVTGGHRVTDSRGGRAVSEESYVDRLVDADALADYLTETLGPADDLTVRHHAEGHSNETLFVDWGDRELVLRRPPAGEHASAAHEVLREYRVTSALADTPIPLPRMVAACDDHDVIGSDFYLMERLEGDVIRDDEPERFADPQVRRALTEEFVDVLAEIHTLDPAAVGLDDLGHPEGYTARQVETWTGQLEWAMEVTADDRPVPDLLEVADWLAENVPEPEAHTLVHGDYKLDNVMFGPGLPPEIVGVFDWEMCTRGDPCMDLGWLLSAWPDETDPDRTTPFGDNVESREGYPTRLELLDRYEAKTGLTFHDERFYRTFGVFKSAGACEMMYRRHLEGNADDPAYPLMEEHVPALADRAMAIIEGEEPL